MRRFVLCLVALVLAAGLAPGAAAQPPGLGGCASEATLKPVSRAGAGGTIALHAEILCDSDQFELAIESKVTRDGKPVPGLAGQASCAYGPTTSCTEVAADATSKLPRLAGRYVITTTFTFAGLGNATLFVVAPAPPAGCTYDQARLAITCTGERVVTVK